MKYLSPLALLLFIGCAVTRPNFDQSNQVFIEKTIKAIDIGKTISSILPRGTYVALVSIELDSTIDYQLVAMIEDFMIQSLVHAGFKVLERDADLVKRLIEESHGKNYSLINLDPFYGDSTANVKVFGTNIRSVDYIISYRILECGLVYNKSLTSTSNMRREGLTRLFIRVQKKDGEIIYANNLDGKHKDEIPIDFVGMLSNYHYTFFPYEYPLQPELRAKPSLLVRTKTVSKVKFYFEPKLGVIFDEVGEWFGYGLNIGIAGENEFGYVDWSATEGNFGVLACYEQVFGDQFGAFVKAGIGYAEVEYEYGPFMRLYEWETAVGLCLEAGAGVYYELGDIVRMKLGYHHRFGLSHEKSGSGLIQFGFGFKL